MDINFKKTIFKRSLRARYARAPKRLPRALYPARLENKYRIQVLEILKALKIQVDKKIKPLIPGLVKYYGKTRRDADDLPNLADELDSLRAELRGEGVNVQTSELFTPDQIKRLAENTGKSVQEWNARQMNGQLRGIVEIDVFGSEPWLAKTMGAFIVDNVHLITSVENEFLDQIQKLIATSVRSGVRAEDIADELEDRYDVSRSRAELIARDQVGKFNGQLTEQRQTDIGIDEYIWRDSGDTRVRPSHHEHNGKTFRWDDPPSETGHPGSDYQCRCGAEPVLDKFFEEAA